MEGVCVIKKLVIIAANTLCLIAFIICLSVSASLRNPLRSQQAISAWGGQSGDRFAQLSAFFPESSDFNEDSIRGLNNSIDKALLAASLESRPGRNLYTDAWSAAGIVSVLGERGSASAKAIGVGGDFFLFHPLYLRDGSYILPGDIMKDRVVIDEELAWRLFGSVRLAGFEILINNLPFTIAGVVTRENDSASQKAYADGAGLFMSFEALSALTDGEAGISCYEIVMPDPITGFALAAITEAFAGSNVHIVENSARFSLGNSFAAIGAFGERSMQKDAIAFPYWENAARYVEDWLALLLLLALIFIVFPIICGVYYSVRIIRFLFKQGKKAVKKAVKQYDDRKYEKYMLEHYEDSGDYDVDDIIREVKES